MANKGQLLTLLSRHIGHDLGVTAEQLASELDSTPRTVRTFVSKLRSDGVAVCGHPATGYFIAATPVELEETCRFLRARALHSLVIESKLRQVPLADLIGQMRLKT